MIEHITINDGLATAWRDGDPVGEWQAGPREYRAAVQAAYDAIPEGDMSQDVLDEVIAAGGKWVKE